MLTAGMVLSVPASLLAAYAPSDEVLFMARVVGGVSAGMAYPTTLALITALWAGPGRTKAIALWSAIGGGIAALGPLIAGILLEHFWWGCSGWPPAPRNHRVRFADGRGVRQPAVPAERARLHDCPGGRRDPAGDRADDPRCPAVRQAGRIPRRSIHAAFRLCVPLPRLRVDAAALEGGKLLLGDRARLRVHRHRRRGRGDARVALTDRLGAGAVRWDGVGHRRSASRPRRGAAHLRLRRALLAAGYA